MSSSTDSTRQDECCSCCDCIKDNPDKAYGCVVGFCLLALFVSASVGAVSFTAFACAPSLLLRLAALPLPAHNCSEDGSAEATEAWHSSLAR